MGSMDEERTDVKGLRKGREGKGAESGASAAAVYRRAL